MSDTRTNGGYRAGDRGVLQNGGLRRVGDNSGGTLRLVERGGNGIRSMATDAGKIARH